MEGNTVGDDIAGSNQMMGWVKSNQSEDGFFGVAGTSWRPIQCDGVDETKYHFHQCCVNKDGDVWWEG